MFSEGDAHHLIFFAVRDGATATMTARGTGGRGGRIISYRLSVCEAVSAAGGGISCGGVRALGERMVWTCIGTRNIGIIDMGRRGWRGRCRELDVTMRWQVIIHGAYKSALWRHNLKMSDSEMEEGPAEEKREGRK